MNVPPKLLYLSRRIMWQNPNQSWIVMMPDAKVVKFACWVVSIVEKPVMPQAAIK